MHPHWVTPLVDWVKPASTDLTIRYKVISTHSGVGLVEKVKALLVDFVLHVALTDTARPFNTFIHNLVTNR